MTRERDFRSLCQNVKEKLGELSRGIATMKNVCYEQQLHAARIMTGYVEDEKGTGRPELDPDAPASLKPNYKESGPSLLEDAAYKKPTEILMGMTKCLNIASQDPEKLLGKHRFYVEQNLRLDEGTLKTDADIFQVCAFLEANSPSQDGSYSQDMTRFRLVLLKRISSAMPALRESLEDIRNRIVVTGDIPAFDYHNPNKPKAEQKETLRNIYPKFDPAEDRLQEMIDSTKELEKTLNGMIEGFWGSVGDSPKGDGPSNPTSRIISLAERRGAGASRA